MASIDSKLNRAICAYLIAEEAGTAEDTFPEQSSGEKTYPNTTVRSKAIREAAADSGIMEMQVFITIRGSLTTEAADAAARAAALQAFHTRVQEVFDALVQANEGSRKLDYTRDGITEAGQALAADPNNADLADFTCTGWHKSQVGEGEEDAEGNALEKVAVFKAFCVETALE